MALEQIKINVDKLHIEENDYLRLAQCVCKSNPIQAIVKQTREPFQPSYSHMCREFDITSQNNSGRCWIFSACNLLRINMRAILPDLPSSFELSQTYIFFYDKLEKCNKFLHNVIETAGMDITDRAVSFLLSDPIPDGGQWNMFVNIIHKYGIVTKQAYGDTFCSDNSAIMNSVLTHVLRECAVEIRESKRHLGTRHTAWLEHVHRVKGDCVQKIYEILVTCLGKPPCKFDFSYVISRDAGDTKGDGNEDKDKNVGLMALLHVSDVSEGVYKASNHGTPGNAGSARFVHKDMSPRQFLKRYVKHRSDEYMCLVNDPRNAMYEKYKVQFLGNVIERSGVYLNVPIETLREYTVFALKNGIPVWFGADAEKFINKANGHFDEEQFKWELVFNIPKVQIQSKSKRLKYCDTQANHAMLFTGIDVNPDRSVNLFRIENSWGKEDGQNGYYSCTDKWFCDHVFLVAVPTVLMQKFNDERLKQCCNEQNVNMLNCWDPIGCLAD